MAIVVGLLIGLVLGLTGAGGSVLAVPLLMLLLDLSAHQAIGISLGAVACTAVLGVATQLKSGQIQWLPAIVYASLGAVFAPIGRIIGEQVPAPILMSGFGLLVLVIAARMWTQASTQPESTRIVRAGRIDQEAATPALCRGNEGNEFRIGLPCISAVSGGAITTGLLSGLFGVGGGFIIIPTLLFLTGISIKQAVATSLVIISVISTSGFAAFLYQGNEIDTSILGLVALGGLAGMLVGTMAAKHIAGPALQKTFAIIMIAMAIIAIVQQFI